MSESIGDLQLRLSVVVRGREELTAIAKAMASLAGVSKPVKDAWTGAADALSASTKKTKTAAKETSQAIQTVVQSSKYVRPQMQLLTEGNKQWTASSMAGALAFDRMVRDARGGVKLLTAGAQQGMDSIKLLTAGTIREVADANHRLMSGAMQDIKLLTSGAWQMPSGPMPQARGLQTRFSGMFNSVLSAARQFGAHLRSTLTTAFSTAVRGAANAFVGGMHRIQSSLQRAQRSLRQMGGDGNGLARDFRKLTISLDDVEHRLDAVWRAAFRFQLVGQDMRAAGMAVLGTMARLTQQFGDYEFMLNRAAGALGLFKQDGGEVVDLYNRLSDSIQDSSYALGLFKPEEVAKATYYWASTTGQQVKNIRDLEIALEGVTPIMQAAALTETDYETAIKGVYSILVQYGKGLTEAGDVTEKLMFITQRTAAEFPDLINSFKMVGPIAEANNVSFEEMVSIFGRLSDAGIRGTMAGRAVRQMLIKLVRPTAMNVTLLNRLWKQTEEFGGRSYMETVFPEGEFVGLNRWLNMLATGLAYVTTEQRNFFLASISTANELPVLTALVEDEIDVIHGAYNQLSADKTDLSQAADTFRKSFELLSTSWKGTSERFLRSLEVVQLRLGQTIAEWVTPYVKELGDAVRKVSGWMRQNNEFVSFATKAAAVAGAIATVAGALAGTAGVLLAVGTALTFAVQGFLPLTGTFLRVFGLLTGVIQALVRNWDWLANRFDEVNRNIAEALSNITGEATKAESGLSALLGGFQVIFDRVIRAAGEFAVLLSNIFKTLSGIGPFKDFVGMLASLASVLWAGKLLSGMGRMLIFATGIGKVMRVLGGLFRATTPGVTSWIGFIGLMASASAAGAVGTLNKIGAGLRGALFAMKELAIMNAGRIFGAIVLGLAAAYYTNFLGFGEWIDSITDKFRDLKKEVREAYDEIGENSMAASRSKAFIRSLGKDVEGLREELRLLEIQKPSEAMPWGSREEYQQAYKDWETYKASLERSLENFANTDFGRIFTGAKGDMDKAFADWAKYWEQYGITAWEATENVSYAMQTLGITSEKDLIAWTRAVVAGINDVEQGTGVGLDRLLELYQAFGGDMSRVNDALVTEGFLSSNGFLTRSMEVFSDRMLKDIQGIEESLKKGWTNLSLEEQGAIEQRYLDVLKTMNENAELLSPEAKAAMDTLTANMPQAVRENLDEALEMLSQAPGEIVSAFATAAENVDVKKLKKAWKKLLDMPTPGELLKNLGKFMGTGRFQQGMRTWWGGLQIDQLVADVYDQFTTAFRQGGPRKQVEWSRVVRKVFGDMDLSALPPETQSKIGNLLALANRTIAMYGDEFPSRATKRRLEKGGERAVDAIRKGGQKALRRKAKKAVLNAASLIKDFLNPFDSGKEEGVEAPETALERTISSVNLSLSNLTQRITETAETAKVEGGAIVANLATGLGNPESLAAISTNIDAICALMTAPSLVSLNAKSWGSRLVGDIASGTTNPDALTALTANIGAVLTQMSLPGAVPAHATGWGRDLVMNLATGVADPDALTALGTNIGHVLQMLTSVSHPRNGAYEWGKQLIDNLAGGIGDKDTNATLATNISNVVSAAAAPSYLRGGSYGWGRDMVLGFARGMDSGYWNVVAAANALAAAVRARLHFSRPDTGPLRDYERWPTDFVNTYARNLSSRKNLRVMERAANRQANAVKRGMDSGLGKRNFTVTRQQQSKRTIEVKVVVTSPDGSVDRLKADEIAELIQGPEYMDAFEHFAQMES